MQSEESVGLVWCNRCKQLLDLTEKNRASVAQPLQAALLDLTEKNRASTVGGASRNRALVLPAVHGD